jgi:integrase
MHRKSACVETFKSLYEKWLPTRIEVVSKSAIESYRIAYDYIQSIANIPINLIKYSDMQCVIDNMRDNGLSYASAKKVRTLLSLLSKYAIVNDIDIKDYTSFLNLGHDVSVYPHKPFTRQQINRLWCLDTSDTYGILILLYTGMRCGELLSLRKTDINLRTRCLIIRQSKTEAGRNRLIPIHNRILPIVTTLYHNTSDKILPVSYAQFSKQFKSVMTVIN